MRRTVKLIVLAVAVVMIISVLASCGAKASGKTTNVTITITAGDTVILKDTPVAVVSDEPTVLLAFQQAMDDDNDFPNVVFAEDADGNPVDVQDIGEFVDTAEKFWEFRLNNQPLGSAGKAASCKIREGDAIYFEYGATVDDAAESN